MNHRFIIQQSTEKPGYWVCTDTENKIVCVFKDHDFNGDQKFTPLETIPGEKYMEASKWIREMSDWLRENHYDKIF